MTLQAIAGYLFAGTGTGLIGIAALGLLRLPDVYNRVNAVTKAAALGVICVLIGALILVPHPATAAALGLGIILQIFTTPLSAYAVGRAAYRSGAPLSPTTHHNDLNPRPQ